jgi:hypothetical protein
MTTQSNFELVFDRALCCRVFAFLERMCVMRLSLRQVPARKDAVYSFQVSGLVISACTLGHALTTMLPSATFLFLNGQLTSPLAVADPITVSWAAPGASKESARVGKVVGAIGCISRHVYWWCPVCCIVPRRWFRTGGHVQPYQCLPSGR